MSEPPVRTSPDTGLKCPSCGYNLTGLPEPRCPECGEKFDLDKLRRLADPQFVQPTPWEVSRTPAGYLKTWYLATIRPDQLAEAFPPHCNASAAISYSAVSCILAGIMLVLTWLVLGLATHNLQLVAGAVICAFVGTLVACGLETAIAIVLTGLVKPIFADEPHRFWRGLVHYTSGYMLLCAVWGSALMCLVVVFSPAYADLLAGFAVVTAAMILLAWYVTLGVMVSARGRPGLRSVLACLVVLVLGGGAVSFASLAAYSLVEWFCSRTLI